MLRSVSGVISPLKPRVPTSVALNAMSTNAIPSDFTHAIPLDGLMLPKLGSRCQAPAVLFFLSQCGPAVGSEIATKPTWIQMNRLEQPRALPRSCCRVQLFVTLATCLPTLGPIASWRFLMLVAIWRARPPSPILTASAASASGQGVGCLAHVQEIDST